MTRLKNRSVLITFNCDLIADSFIVTFLYCIFASYFLSTYYMKLPRNDESARKFLIFSLLLIVTGEYIM